MEITLIYLLVILLINDKKVVLSVLSNQLKTKISNI